MEAFMLNRTVKSALIVIVLILAIASAVAATKGNEAKGRYYFRQTCKECHTKGAAGGEVTPLSKTQEQWRRYFTAGKHSKGKEPLAKLVSAEQLTDVQTFLVNHAADSLQPETCGK
jgi:mono/diheme cytochrome c family protein